ncbi:MULTISPECIES: hypothetical protein [Streptomyces]|uniref:hypothetical protein n=1 Tax=Streptomyces TaxID=1883 RepID=UPI003662D4CA
MTDRTRIDPADNDVCSPPSLADLRRQAHEVAIQRYHNSKTRDRGMGAAEMPSRPVSSDAPKSAYSDVV